MGSFFRRLGERFGRIVRQANWVFAALTGTEDEAIRAERRFGRDMARSLGDQFPEPPPDEAREIVDAVGRRLAAVVKNRRRQSSFAALVQPVLNAYALPGGFVFVTAPLVDLCQRNQDNLAFVLGHEIGHVLRSHARDRLLNSALLSALSALAPASRQWNLVFGRITREFAQSAYSQEQEFEADESAVRLAGAAGFDPAAGLVVMDRLAEFGPRETATDAYFSTHPPRGERIARIKRLLASS